MLAEVPPILVDLGLIAGIFTGVLAAVAAFARTRPVRFLWRSLVSKPVGEWQTKQIEAVVKPLEEKLDAAAEKIDETSTALVDHMGEEVRLREADLIERAGRQDDNDAQFSGIRDAISGLRGDIGTIHGRLDDVLLTVAAGNPEDPLHRRGRPEPPAGSPDDVRSTAEEVP